MDNCQVVMIFKTEGEICATIKVTKRCYNLNLNKMQKLFKFESFSGI
jgi:hypothetical protein